MPGIDPSILASIGSSSGPAGMPPDAAAPPPGASDEPIEVHDACLELCEVVKSAREMAEALIGQVELAEDIDPGTEQKVQQAVDMLGQVDMILDEVQEAIGAGRPDEEESPGGDESSAAAGPAAPPV